VQLEKMLSTDGHEDTRITGFGRIQLTQNCELSAGCQPGDYHQESVSSGVHPWLNCIVDMAHE
jgi:hypothetical protein